MAMIGWRPNAVQIRHERRRAAIEELVAESVELLSAEVPELSGCYVTRSELREDMSLFTAYIHSLVDGIDPAKFIEPLKLYTPSIRKYVAESLNFRKTPKIFFVVDHLREKHERLEELLDKVSEELKVSSDKES